ncbi:MAG: dihydroxyacetone kinase family protein [Nostocoides sp.]
MSTSAEKSTSYAAAALQGYIGAYPGYVRPVWGGVVRAKLEAPRVRLVIGGGSGHYPAFAGWVGAGLADGAVCGDVFASPSAARVRSVARAVEPHHGVVLGFGNYTGDSLNFGQAAEELRATGIDARVLAVTDDIASAPAAERFRRRGIAGDLVVFKMVAAAAQRGLSIDDVVQVGRRANESTSTLGVAFAGCTLPGADREQFTVAPGTMAIGLGIHGEPGLETVPRPDDAGLAALLVDRVVAELPEGTRRVAVLLNGFGAFNNEAIFSVYRSLHDRLRSQGLVPVGAHVGQQVSSLDMSGLSLTLTALDDELETLWLAPASTPSFHRSADDMLPVEAGPSILHDVAPEDGPPLTAGSAASNGAAEYVAHGLAEVCASLIAAEAHLGRLDAVAGDGDHGKGMVAGASAACTAAEGAVGVGAGVRTTLLHAARAWSDNAGGTSGALWATGMAAAARVLGDEADVDASLVAEAVKESADAIAKAGSASVGDKTMLDAVVPFADELFTLVGSGQSLGEAWEQAARQATLKADETAQLVARFGRARTHGDRSVGTPDPGAVSFALVMTAAAKAVARRQGVA